MRLGDMLLQAKVISDLQLNAAIAEQQRWGGKLGQILVRMGALTEDLLVLALCRQLNLPRADLDALQFVPDALKQRIDRATCERYHIVPLAYVADRRAMQLAMSDPFDVAAVDDLTRMLGTRIEPFLVGDNALGAAIRRLYSATSTTMSMQENDPMALMDNAGNARVNRPAPPRTNTRAPVTMPPVTTTIPPATIAPATTLPPAASAASAAGAASAPTSATGANDYAARVDEQLRAVRAVAALLVEHGVIRPEDLPR